MQSPLCAGDADIHEPPFFLNTRSQLLQRRIRITQMRQNALLDAYKKNMRKLQPLGGMQCRKMHGILFLILAFEHRHQRHHLRQFQQILFRPILILAALAFLLEPIREFQHILPLVPCCPLIEIVVEISNRFSQTFSNGVSG